ncbi:MAG: phytanoyl-CoA dioxygenase family protein [Burkholderiales bacterium]|nr:phytanoyl-CoA dioxygenase family protein [Burkholderiales bacterium]
MRKFGRMNATERPTFVSEALKQHFLDEGWVVLEGAVDLQLVDGLVSDVAAFRRAHDDGKDEFGHGKRIGLLHVALERSLKVALNKPAIAFLKWYFGDDPVLFGSLTFEVGTEQNAHHDAAFFHTEPADAMAGVWIALEDIDDDSGPLFYIPRSHRLPRLKARDVLNSNPGLRERVLAFRQSGKRAAESIALADEVYAAWDVEMQRRLAELGAVKAPALLKKGDVFVWHGWLIHGGLPRRSMPLSRRSMVCHFIARHSRMWDQYDFFLNGDKLDDIPPLGFQYIRCPHGTYIYHEKPVVFSAGNGFFRA